MARPSSILLLSLGIAVLPLVLCVSVVTVTPPVRDPLPISVRAFEKEFYEEFQTFVSTRSESEKLKSLKKTILDNDLPIAIQELPRTEEPHTCLLCRTASYSFLQFNASLDSNTKALTSVARDLCSVLSMDSQAVCEGLIERTTPTVDYILRNSSAIDADRVCSIWFQALNCGESDRLSEAFPVNYPVPRAPVASKRATAPSSATPLVVVHLSDFHVDPYYVPGADAHCGNFVCCRNDHKKAPNVTGVEGAGYWGDYRPCDSPWHTVEDIVDRVKAEYPHIDLIYYTGDIVDHFSWQTSIEHNTHSIRKMTEFLRQQFPNTPIYPVLGNHEAHPANSIAPSYASGENVSSQWLFDLVYEEWGPWLPEEARQGLRQGGLYSVLVLPKLRLVALNNNYCFGTNLWLLHSTDYFADELHWFRGELARATENEEKVHVIAHIPTNDMKCFAGWAREYRKIMEEFSETVVGVFNGHTHEDEFNVYYSLGDPSKATGAAFNGGSGTTFAFFNSNFKVYSVDAASFEVLDYDAWHYNLTEANLFPGQRPKWQKTYSFKEAYDLPDLSPHSLDALAQRLGSDRALLRTYWERKEKYSDWMLREGCDDKCLKKNFCDIVTMVHGDYGKCEELYRI